MSAGLNLFIRKGYAATKTLDISQAAGISEGLLFHYFETKEKLYEELVKIGISGPQSILTGIKSEPLEFFLTAAKVIFEYVEADSFVAKMFVLMKQAQFNDAAPQSIKEILKENKILSVSIEKIKMGQKNGTIRKGDPFALSLAYWGAVQGIAEQAALFPELPIPQSEWIADIIRRRK